VVLLSLAFSLTWFYKKYPRQELIPVFLLLTTLSQFQLFHFSHYALAEVFCLGLTLLSLVYFLQWYERYRLGRRPWLSLVKAALFLFLAYSAKIQYLYLAFIPSMVIFLLGIAQMFRRDGSYRKLATQFAVSVLVMLGFMLVYAAWYFMNRDFYDYIMLSETSGRFASSWHDLLVTARFNTVAYLWTRETRLLVLLSLLSIPAYLALKRFGKPGPVMELVFLFGLAWLILEMHKLPMVYLPNRYLLSMFFAMGLVLSAVLAMLAGEGRYGRMLAYCFVIGMSLVNLSFIYDSYGRRSHDLAAVNKYFSTKDLGGAYVLGSWSPSFTWETKVKAIPVWHNYFNWFDPVNTFHPRCIITEYNEAESDHAYAQQGIKLDSVSDSSRMFRVWRYDVIVYWIKPNPGR
jgi:hypothetical protein